MEPLSLVIGTFDIWIALQEDPCEYMGQNTFGWKFIKWKYVKAALFAVGVLNIIEGLGITQ